MLGSLPPRSCSSGSKARRGHRFRAFGSSFSFRYSKHPSCLAASAPFFFAFIHELRRLVSAWLTMACNQVVAEVFPTSDHWHVVATPATLVACHLLTHCSVANLRNMMAGTAGGSGAWGLHPAKRAECHAWQVSTSCRASTSTCIRVVAMYRRLWRSFAASPPCWHMTLARCAEALPRAGWILFALLTP
jgi:hypothetical protein